jgi:heterodisulfide reductase subunit A-like polyferredoxin
MIRPHASSHHIFRFQYSFRRFYSEFIDLKRSIDQTDVLVIGGGPSGLATAIRLKQLAALKAENIRVVLLEKGPEIGKDLLKIL